MYFEYGERETEYLKSRDGKLAEVIDKIGHINREVEPDLFSAVVLYIIGQQISTKAHKTIWQRMKDGLGEINADTILNLSAEKLQRFGITFRKADYITDFAERVISGRFKPEDIYELTDEEAAAALTSLKGVGVWTAEMIMLFCLQRQNVFSYGDLAILRGIRMIYHHKEIDKQRFERYRARFSPFCSVASLYFWAAAGGAYSEH